MSIKQIAAIRRKPGLTHAEFSSYVRNVHGQLAAAKTLGVDRYVQNHVFDGAYGTATDTAYAGISGRDLVTELWFADATAMQQTFSDPYSQTTLRSDGAKFNDFTTAAAAITREATLTLCAADPGDVKAFYYMKAVDSADADRLETAVRVAHGTFPQTHPSEAGFIQECVASIPVSQSTNSAHFGGAAAPAFDAIVMLRFADEAGLTAFRPYQRELERSGLINSSASFVVFTREAVIFDVLRGQTFVPAHAVA